MPKADIAIHPQKFIRMLPLGGSLTGPSSSSSEQRISVREDVLFTDFKGDEKSGVRKRNAKAMDKLRPALERMLLPGEAVLYVARARTPLSIVEQITAGWWIHALAGAALVLTNQRILFFPTKIDGSWKESVRGVQWGDVSEVKPVGLIVRNVTFKFKNGRKETYTGFRRGDAKKIAAMAQILTVAAAGEQSMTQGIVQLCPDCRSALVPGVYACNACGLTFKNERAMVWRSILLPAGGYFYTGYPLIALIPAIAEVMLLLEIVVLLVVGATGPNRLQDLLGFIIVFAMVWGFETAITILHCRRYIRQYIPLKRSARARQTALAAKAGV